MGSAYAQTTVSPDAMTMAHASAQMNASTDAILTAHANVRANAQMVAMQQARHAARKIVKTDAIWVGGACAQRAAPTAAMSAEKPVVICSARMAAVLRADATKLVPNAPAMLVLKAHHVMKTRADVPA